MFEDIAKNLIVPHDLGMTTTLIIPKTIDPFREEFEQTAVEAPTSTTSRTTWRIS